MYVWVDNKIGFVEVLLCVIVVVVVDYIFVGEIFVDRVLGVQRLIYIKMNVFQRIKFLQ